MKRIARLRKWLITTLNGLFLPKKYQKRLKNNLPIYFSSALHFNFTLRTSLVTYKIKIDWFLLKTKFNWKQEGQELINFASDFNKEKCFAAIFIKKKCRFGKWPITTRNGFSLKLNDANSSSYLEFQDHGLILPTKLCPEKFYESFENFWLAT